MHVVASGLISAVLVAAAVPATPAEILEAVPAPSGFELVSDEDRTLDYAGLADASPQSVAHVDPATDVARDLVGGLDVWNLGEDDVLLREVVRWGDDSTAAGYLDEWVDFATGENLVETDAPFDGARAFTGDDPTNDVWTHLVVWTDGSFGASINHFHFGGDPSDEIVDRAAELVADRIDAVTATDQGGDATSSSGGGIPILTVLIWLLVIGGAIWLFVKIRRRLRSAKQQDTSRRRADRPDDDSDDHDDDDELDVDDIIERARARGRAEREIDAIPDPSDEWTPPDDY